MQPDWLICFAVPEEARPFQKRLGTRADVRIGLSGIGPHNARRYFENAVLPLHPRLVLTAGFAGGLAPSLRVGEVLFDADEASGLAPLLAQAGARRGTFHCAERIAATVGAKRALWEATGADAVEMESGILRALCRQHGLASATVRVISDAAEEDLPLDFNDLMTADCRLNHRKLAARLLRQPAALVQLWGFRRQIARAAAALAGVLLNVLDARSRSAS